MPVVTIYGISDFASRHHEVVKDFTEEDLPATIASVEGLGIESGKVSVFIVPEVPYLHSKGSKQVIIFIEGLFQRPERTPEVFQELAEVTRNCAATFAIDHLPECEMIEVIPRSQRPDDGFADWRRRD